MTMVVLLMAAMMQGGAPVRPLEKGDQSNMDDARQAVVRSAAELDALWRLHAPERPQPKVDFSREMIVAVFLGTRPTAGYAVDIVGTRKDDTGALVVQYREARPARGMLTAQVLTSAYAIVALPRHDGAVRFEQVGPK